MKLVVSVMPRNFEEAQAIDASRYQDADVIEWRADYLDKNDILQVAPAIFEKFAGREIYLRYGPGSREEKLSFLVKST